MNYLKAVYKTFLLQLRQSFSRATFRFCIIVQPLIYTFVLYMMYKDSNVTNYMNQVILGSGLCSLWSSVCFSSAGDIERERYMGTLENLFCCPVPFPVIVLGKILANTFLGLLGLVLSLGFSKIIFNKSMSIANMGGFLISFLLVVFSFISVSLLISPVFTLSKNARALMNCLEAPVFILCGFIAPISILPKFLLPISYILPPTLSVDLIRESANGTIDFKLFLTRCLFLILLCSIYLFISKILFKKIDYETRITNTLGGL